MGFDIVVIGTSTGGLMALEILLSGLPRNFALPIAIVQHRSVDSGEMLCIILRRHSRLPVLEPHDKEAILPGRVYMAPPDYHLMVEEGAFALSTEGPVSYARPSIDVLFESAADAYRAGVIGVVLTGANQDGARGAVRIKARGGVVVVQDPATAECPVMPQATQERVAVDWTLPLEEIVSCLVRLSGQAEEGKPSAVSA
ncbi:MAG TPA: chemotaxis protein CheB [Chthonomonadaceae bacterium]|nr:chemotaxis protein CheB [Chthonomonadaceae bacterium]